MKQLLNTKGSSWRKWDLHIHSPASVLNSDFGGDWEKYFKVLEELDDISVIGITDYFSINGYKRVKKHREEGNLKNIDMILPNVELRLNTTTYKNRAINIHIVFSPEVDGLIEKYFLEELEFEYDQNPYKCTEDDLRSLGEIFLKEEYSPEKALFEGMKQFKVSLDKLKTVLQKQQKRFKDKYLIIIPNSNVDGNSGNKEDSFKAIRRELYHFSHAIFSGNPSDRPFFLGESNYEETIDQCGKIMPCLHGSDAHSHESVGKPAKNRFTWIKAEPVFEGLLQVLHEPKERVIIQEENPDVKNDYDVISSIQFCDSTDFTNREIKLNPGLNTVVGGKSSGKSLLIYKIAQAVSREEIEVRENDTYSGEILWKNPYKSTFIEDVDFKVTWRNGEVSQAHQEREVGKITYIPQMYINALSEDTANYVLQKKIREIVLQDRESLEFWSAKGTKHTQLKKELRGEIIKFFDSLQEELSLVTEIKKIGDKEVIEKEKEKLEEQLKLKIDAANLTPEDENNIKENESTKEQIEHNLQVLEREKENDKKLSYELNGLYDIFSVNLKDIKENYSDRIEILDDLHIAISSAFTEIQSKVQYIINEHDQKKEIEQQNLKDVLSVLNPLLEKMEGVSQINLLKSKIEEQNKYLIKIDTLEKEKEQLRKFISGKRENIISIFEELFNIKKEIKEYFNTKRYFNDIKLATYLDFEDTDFNETFMSIFIRRGRLSNLFSDYEKIGVFDEKEQFVFNEHDFIEKIKYLFSSVLELEERKFRKGYNKQKAIEELLSSAHIRVVFDLEKDGDKLSEMSPGKRGLVLLELFLDMSNEKHPILIDQPEDNLDNRTISTELVKFIKEKSRQRQIIVVTHNANLVVLTDAENVIIANQDKQLIENDANRFEYINGALECDFDDKTQKLSGKGIKSHVCEILEGGKEAFEKREKKYGF
ncbi:hypothetical protein CON23_12180 [Bacillus thuringiensis]|uniref:TrlF family AAA-like ATPase n=1 Tax=Bacillus thuringiensis TaxID=1428 RepID=UPI000BEDFB0C|nr:hypothetical protein [Bacillus thuringiensis]PEF12260.1 hypothetical protein CON23_12180 [Bacillus thuringiensis]